MELYLKHFINGDFVDSLDNKRFEFLNPANNEVLGTIPVGCKEDVDKAVRAAKKAFEIWSNTSASKRSDILHEVARLIRKNKEELTRLETLNTGIPITQVRAQIERAAENFDFFADMITKLSDEVFFDDTNNFINYVIRTPIGVAGLITPWNTPLMLETWKIAPCLAAGDTCVLKPAEWTPLGANKLAEIIQDAGVFPGAFNIVHGIGEISGASLVAHQDVRLISFTGETTTGMEIMRNGASTLKRFSMELGGKNPAIVFSDADLKKL